MRAILLKCTSNIFRNFLYPRRSLLKHKYYCQKSGGGCDDNEDLPEKAIDPTKTCKIVCEKKKDPDDEVVPEITKSKEDILRDPSIKKDIVCEPEPKLEEPCPKDPCKKDPPKSDPCDQDPCKQEEKKPDPCQQDPCKQDTQKPDPCSKPDPCKQEPPKPDPCAKFSSQKELFKSDPCGEDPCAKPDPCGIDPCKRDTPEDPCKKPVDPCKMQEPTNQDPDPCKPCSDPCAPEDPCKPTKLEKDPCGLSDPCGVVKDPCKKQVDPCKMQEPTNLDPDPCKPCSDPCAAEDPCKPRKLEKDPCGLSDPCTAVKDPCKKQVDPCKMQEPTNLDPDPCKPCSDPCAAEDPCKPMKLKKDPCGLSDPCGAVKDPCKKQVDPCKMQEPTNLDPDPCKPCSDPCAAEDPCKPTKLSKDPCGLSDPCGATADICEAKPPCKPTKVVCEPVKDPCKVPKPGIVCKKGDPCKQPDPCDPNKPIVLTSDPCSGDDPCKQKAPSDPCKPCKEPCSPVVLEVKSICDAEVGASKKEEEPKGIPCGSGMLFPLKRVNRELPEIRYKDIPKEWRNEFRGAWDNPDESPDYSRPVRLEYPAKVIWGFIPLGWREAFYKRTGFTGFYTLLFTVGTFLFSKEIYIIEHEFFTGLTWLVVLPYIVSKYKTYVARKLDESIDEHEAKWNESRNVYKRIFNELIDREEQHQWSLEGQHLLVCAKRENVDLQIEREYRRRMDCVRKATIEQLNYHVAVANLKRNIYQRDIVGYVKKEVEKSLTGEFLDKYLDNCMLNLEQAINRVKADKIL